MFRLICLLIGYIIGCIQTSYLIGKYVYNVDIREHGSGNAGSTNTTRIFGKKTGLVVFICDVSKAIIGFMIGSYLFSFIPGIYTGVGVMLGHNFPFFMGFKGGKGVASFLGVLLAFDFKIAIICYIIGIFTTLLFKYISLASMVMGIIFPIILILFNMDLEVIIIAIFLAIMIIIKHSQNVKRLINGNERKVGGTSK
jgi:acyl phosphate:glycerol-3-phosphate acyltransferase